MHFPMCLEIVRQSQKEFEESPGKKGKENLNIYINYRGTIGGSYQYFENLSLSDKAMRKTNKMNRWF